MANGCDWTSKRLILGVFLCVLKGVVSGRHTQIERVLTSGSHGRGQVVVGEEAQLEVWGSGLSWSLELGLTSVDGVQGSSCTSVFTPPLAPDDLTHARATFTLPPTHSKKIPFVSKTEVWLCTRERPHYGGGRARHMGGWIHQGPASRLVIVPGLQRSSHRLSLRSVERPPPLIESEAGPLPSNPNVASRPVIGGDEETPSSASEGNNNSESVPDKPAGDVDDIVLRIEEEERTGPGGVVGGGVVTEDGLPEVPLEGVTLEGEGVEGEEVPTTSGVHRDSGDVVNLVVDVPEGGDEGGVWESITVRTSEDSMTMMAATEAVLAPGEDATRTTTPVGGGDVGDGSGDSRVVMMGDDPRTSGGEEKEGGESGLKGVGLSDSVMDMMKESLLEEEETPSEVLVDGKEEKGKEKLPKEAVVSASSSVVKPSAGPVDFPEGIFNPKGIAAAAEAATASSSEGAQLIKVSGLRVEDHSKGLIYEDDSGSVMVDTDAAIRFFGVGFTEDTEFLFTSYEEEYGTPCIAHTTKSFKVEELGDGWGKVTVKLPVMSVDQSHWYLCARRGPNERAYHQGTASWLTMKSWKPMLPLWLQGCFIVVLLCLSGLFSGLNLGLMALDKTELKIVSNTGSPVERRHARAIEPVRSHGNFLLCTLLLGNVLVNSSLTILLDELSSGLVAVIGSTIGIVIFGEIIPQAVCSRHGLAVGARTVWLVRVFMVLTGPASYPISKILDFVLGEEIGNTYDRERLKELIKVTHDHIDLKTEEQNIICGALEFHIKTVGEVMTKLDDIYMLSVDACLDFNTINEMMQQGFSRVPVFEGERTNIVSMLFIKDLAFIDPDDNTPLKTLCQFYQNPLNFVFVDTTLDLMLKDFKEGSKGHMAFVQKVNSEGECDPFYEVVGLVTLEDVIEELIQEEIVDETDVFTDNRNKRRRQIMGRRDFTEFSQTGNQTNHKRVQISSQMQVAAFQYLRTSIEPFKEGQLSEVIVKKLLNQDVIHSIKMGNKELSKGEQLTYIFTHGKQVDYFVLILEGHVEVVIGKEGLNFESGPFTYFGLAALSQAQMGLGESPSASTQLSKSSIKGSVQSLESTKFTFVPDYSVRAITEVMYLKIRRSQYIAARRAFLLEQSQKEPYGENFEKEMAKMLNEDEDSTSNHWDTTAPTSKESSGIPNGSAIQTFNCVNSMDANNHGYPPSPKMNSSIKNSVSVPGTPLSSRSQSSMKPSNSFTNLQEFPTSVSSINVETMQNDNQHSQYPLTNNLSESSIEDNGEQKIIGSPDVVANMERHMSLDYKPSNLENEGVLGHRRGESFS